MSNIPCNKAILKPLDIVCCMSSSYTLRDKVLALMAKTDKDLSKLSRIKPIFINGNIYSKNSKPNGE